MRIRVKGYLGVQPKLNTERSPDGKQFVEFEADQATLGDLLVQLGYGSNAAVKTRGTVGRLTVLLNGRHASHLAGGLDTALKDGDEVAIFPPAAGG